MIKQVKVSWSRFTRRKAGLRAAGAVRDEIRQRIDREKVISTEIEPSGRPVQESVESSAFPTEA